jgi:hypothetical protein
VNRGHALPLIGPGFGMKGAALPHGGEATGRGPTGRSEEHSVVSPASGGPRPAGDEVLARLAGVEEQMEVVARRLAAMADEISALRRDQAEIAGDARNAADEAEELAARAGRLEGEVALLRESMAGAAALARESRRRLVRLESRAESNADADREPTGRA